MYIEKIFSEVESDEKLYSVLLDEDEYALYSEFQKEFANLRTACGGASVKLTSKRQLKKLGKQNLALADANPRDYFHPESKLRRVDDNFINNGVRAIKRGAV